MKPPEQIASEAGAAAAAVVVEARGTSEYAAKVAGQAAKVAGANTGTVLLIVKVAGANTGTVLSIGYSEGSRRQYRYSTIDRV
jgi:hypothetical protein